MGGDSRPGRGEPWAEGSPPRSEFRLPTPQPRGEGQGVPRFFTREMRTAPMGQSQGEVMHANCPPWCLLGAALAASTQ